jgi:transcriptional regulator with XRE-family HTH domain
MNNFGDRLKIFRDKKGLTQDEFAEKCGKDSTGNFYINQSNMHQWEKNLSQPSGKKAKALKRGFPDLNYDWLETGNEPMIKSGTLSNNNEPEKLRSENAVLRQTIKEQEVTIKKLQEDVSSLIELLKKK